MSSARGHGEMMLVGGVGHQQALPTSQFNMPLGNSSVGSSRQQPQPQQQQQVMITTSARTKYVLGAGVGDASATPFNSMAAGRGVAAANATSSASAFGGGGGGGGGGGSPRRLLDGSDLRSIRNYIATNSMRPHRHRTGRIHALVPPSPFEALRERPADALVDLSLAAINENESALDVPLRFAAPANLHAPAAVDMQRGVALGARLLATLKGAAGLRPHWDGETTGAEKDYAHVVMVRDATMKSDAARRSGDVRKFAAAQHVLGVMHYNANVMEKALVFFRAAAELSARADVAQWRALNENLATCCMMRLLRWREAAAAALQTSQVCGAYGQAVCLNNAGVCHSAVGDHAAAKHCFDAALRSATAAQDSVLDTISRGNLACAQLRLGELPDAQANLERCLEVCTVAGDSVGSAVVLVLLGETVGAAGDFRRSVFYFEQALRIATECRCAELAKVAQTSIGITKAIGSVQTRLTGADGVAANAAVTSREILASLT